MSSTQPARARRREKTVGAVIALVGVGVLVLAIVALLAARDQGSKRTATVALPSGRTSATPSGTAAASPSTTATASTSTTASTAATGSPSSTAGHLPLVVVNNTQVARLAEGAAKTFTAGGWTVTSTSSSATNILSTCAYYDPAVTGAAAAAKALMAQFPAIKRVKEKFSGLPAGPIVVVLTTDYTAQ